MKKVLFLLFALINCQPAYSLIFVESCEVDINVELSENFEASFTADWSDFVEVESVSWFVDNDVQGTDQSFNYTFAEAGLYSICVNASLPQDTCLVAFSCIELEIEAIEEVEECVGTEVDFNMVTQNWGAEVSWDILNSEGEIVLTSEPYGNNEASQIVACLADGCYTVQMADSFGDGWNGGSLTIVVGGQTTMASLESGGTGVDFFVVNEGDCPVTGCTDPEALNFDVDAEVDNGTCEYPESCEAHFLALSTIGLVQSFLDCSSSNVTSYSWIFGDETTSNEQNPTHVYATAGVYTVCLTVSTAAGCENTECQDVVIEDAEAAPECEAHFLAAGFNHSFSGNFLDCSQGDIVAYEWDFGDGNTSNEENNFYTYADTGLYVVCLTVYASDGCENTECQDVLVQESEDAEEPLIVSDTILLEEECTDIYYQLIINSGLWAQEMYWSITDTSGVLLAEGGNYVNNSNYFIELCLPACFDINLSDSFGDGWNGGTYTLLDAEAEVLGTGTLEGSEATDSYCQEEPVEPEEPAQLTLCGTVSMGNAEQDAIVTGNVFLIEQNPEDGNLVLVEVETWGEGDGSYCFTVDADGTYMIKAELDYISPLWESYLPTYLGDVVSWEDSPMISVTGGSITNLNITLIPTNVEPLTGEGSVEGWIEPGAGKTDAEIGTMTAYLTDLNGNIIDFSPVYEDGYYLMDGLPSGQYWLHIDALGATHEAFLVNVKEGEEDWTINYLLYPNELLENGMTASGLEAIPSDEFSAYPNPASDLLWINNLDGNWLIQIYNLQGQLVHQERQISRNATLGISVRNLHNGQYIARMISESTQQKAVVRFMKN